MPRSFGGARAALGSGKSLTDFCHMTSRGQMPAGWVCFGCEFCEYRKSEVARRVPYHSRDDRQAR
jgi:hypothetical protein